MSSRAGLWIVLSVLSRAISQVGCAIAGQSGLVAGAGFREEGWDIRAACGWHGDAHDIRTTGGSSPLRAEAPASTSEVNEKQHPDHMTHAGGARLMAM